MIDYCQQKGWYNDSYRRNINGKWTGHTDAVLSFVLQAQEQGELVCRR